MWVHKTRLKKFAQISLVAQKNLSCPIYIYIYYMEESVLLGTKPLVDSIRHFIRDPSGVFSVCHFVSVVSFNDVTIPAFCFCWIGFSRRVCLVFI